MQLSSRAVRTEGLWSADVLGGPQAAPLGDTLGSEKSQGCLVVSRDQLEGPSSVVEVDGSFSLRNHLILLPACGG